MNAANAARVSARQDDDGNRESDDDDGGECDDS